MSHGKKINVQAPGTWLDVRVDLATEAKRAGFGNVGDNHIWFIGTLSDLRTLRDRIDETIRHAESMDQSGVWFPDGMPREQRGSFDIKDAHVRVVQNFIEDDDEEQGQ